MKYPRPFWFAVLVSLVLVGMAPFLSEIRDLMKDGLAGGFVLALSGFFAVAVGLQLVVAVARIRDRRALRYGLLTLWAAMMVLQFWVWTRPSADVSAVERIHFVFYSILAVLFYRAFRDRSDLSGMIVTFLAASTVGCLDEGMQWLVPVRVADFSDVLLNAYSVIAGVFLGVALVGLPVDWRPRVERQNLRSIAVASTIFLGVVGGYLQIAHLGHWIEDPAIGSFRSLHTRDELLSKSAERAARWSRNPPGRPSDLTPFEVEDYYRSEAGWHVQQRNRYFSSGDYEAAAREVALLEKYFDPFLDLPNNAGRPFRFGPNQIAELEQGRAAQGAPLDSTWVSPVGTDPGTIFLRPTRVELWTGIGVVLAALWALALGFGSKRP